MEFVKQFETEFSSKKEVFVKHENFLFRIIRPISIYTGNNFSKSTPF